MRHIPRFDAHAAGISSYSSANNNEKKKMTKGTTNPKLSAIRTIRTAWFDEALDAEARGDGLAAAQAKQNVDACDVQIRRLERQLEPRPAPYPRVFMSAYELLRPRA
jgi:hypothetical protein